MKTVDEKIMFEIYRESGGESAYQVIYFTELDEHRRDVEIARAMAGEHVFDGFVAEDDPAARAGVEDVVARLNNGDSLDDTQIGRFLAGYLV